MLFLTVSVSDIAENVSDLFVISTFNVLYFVLSSIEKVYNNGENHGKVGDIRHSNQYDEVSNWYLSSDILRKIVPMYTDSFQINLDHFRYLPFSGLEMNSY